MTQISHDAWQLRKPDGVWQEFKATDADRFLRDVAKVLSKSSLVKTKSMLWAASCIMAQAGSMIRVATSSAADVRAEDRGDSDGVPGQGRSAPAGAALAAHPPQPP